MSPLEHIRKNVFRASQAEFAEIAGTTQASVSRWEKGEQEPGLTEMARIRQVAADRGLPWDDSWFWQVPEQEIPA